MTQKLGDISIIGPGTVGTALGVLAARAGLKVTAIGGRDPRRTQQAARMIRPAATAASMTDAARSGDLILLCVSDDAIEPVFKQLVEEGAFRGGCVIAHCSGALGSELLSPARRLGCHVGSLHPLATFPNVPRAVEALAGCYCFIEGDALAVTWLSELARRIGAIPLALQGQAKPLYHAAAVMACNYQAALIDAALELMKQAGIEPEHALRALAPLARSTMDNILSLGPQQALTGPIARGDLSTVAAHLRAMRRLPRLRALYCQAGQWTIQLARRKGTLSARRAGELERLLRGQSTAAD